MKKIINIEGMSCAHCVKHVIEALEELQGIESVIVHLEDKQAVVEGLASNEAIREAIEEAGYDVISIENQ